ncbi:MAG: hypothetical protein AAGD00_05825 [Planctomycetota bacterium]
MTRVMSAICLVGFALLAAGCDAPFKYTTDVGSVSMSAVVLGEWDQYRDALVPNFKPKDANELRSTVIPTTALYQERIVDAFAASLAVDLEGGVPGGSDEAATAEGSSSPSESMLTRRLASDLPGIDGLGLKNIARDPFLEYQLANALYQEVQILDRFVQTAVIPQGYRAFVVRLNLRPDVHVSSLDWDIDAYTSVSFFLQAEGLKTGKLYPLDKVNGRTSDSRDAHVRVLPLLVTDHLEAALQSRSAETLRQLAAALSGTIGSVGGSADIESVYNEISDALAREANSLVSVARSNENTVRVRLGGNNSTQRRNLVTRSVPITLLVLVPIDAWQKAEDLKQKFPVEDRIVPSLDVFSHARFRMTKEPSDDWLADPLNHRRGRAEWTRPSPPARYIKEAERLVVEILGDYLLDKGVLTALVVDRQALEEHLSTLVLAASSNNYDLYADEFGKLLCTTNQSGFVTTNRSVLERALWTAFSERFGDFEYKRTSLSLQGAPRPTVVQDLADLIDDSKKSTVTIRGSGLQADGLIATLDVGGEHGIQVIASSKIEVSGGGTVAKIEFPTLKDVRFSGTTSESPLELSMAMKWLDRNARRPELVDLEHVQLTRHVVKPKVVEYFASFAWIPAAHSIKQPVSLPATIQLQIKPKKEAFADLAGDAKFSIVFDDNISVSSVDGATPPADGRWPLAADALRAAAKDGKSVYLRVQIEALNPLKSAKAATATIYFKGKATKTDAKLAIDR